MIRYSGQMWHRNLQRMVAFVVYYFRETLNLHLSSEISLCTDRCVLGTICSLFGIQSGLYARFPLPRMTIIWLLRNCKAMLAASPCQHSPSPVVHAGSGTQRRVSAGWGRAGGTMGAAGYRVSDLGQLSAAEHWKKEWGRRIKQEAFWGAGAFWNF